MFKSPMVGVTEVVCRVTAQGHAPLRKISLVIQREGGFKLLFLCCLLTISLVSGRFPPLLGKLNSTMFLPIFSRAIARRRCQEGIFLVRFAEKMLGCRLKRQKEPSSVKHLMMQYAPTRTFLAIHMWINKQQLGNACETKTAEGKARGFVYSLAI